MSAAHCELSSAILHNHLFDWLNTNVVAWQVGTFRAVAILFGKLAMLGSLICNLCSKTCRERGKGLFYSEVYHVPCSTCSLTQSFLSLTTGPLFISASFAGYHYMTWDYLFWISAGLFSMGCVHDRPPKSLWVRNEKGNSCNLPTCVRR